MKPMIVAMLVVGWGVAQPCHAINKCTDASGKVAYQQEPCDSGSRSSRFESKDNGPPSVHRGPEGATDYARLAREMGTDRKLREIAFDTERLRNDLAQYRREKEAGVLDTHVN